MELSQVSRTAILLLICRAVETEKNSTLFNDPMSVVCLERLLSIASKADKQWMLKKKRMYEGVHQRDARAGVQKGKIFDNAANRFIIENPGCTVINLACGFDTRYWRINLEDYKYLELDLPELITLKKEILKEYLDYELIGCSVLDPAWIDQVTFSGNTSFLLLAEGLFMWLHKQDVITLLQQIAARFDRSQLVLETVPEKYTRGLWKSFLRWHSKLEWGLDVVWVSGFKDPSDLEAFGDGLKVIDVVQGSVGPIITVSINGG